MSQVLDNRTRNTDIDILRGIGAVSVVIGHAMNAELFSSAGAEFIRRFVYLYHLPIFFFCAGYFFRCESIIACLRKLWKQYKLMILFCFGSYFFIPLWVKMGAIEMPLIGEIVRKSINILLFREDAEQNQSIAAYLAEHKELDLQKKYSDRKNDEKARAAFDQMTNDGVERKFDCIIVASMYYCGPDFPAVRQAIKETLYATGIDLIVLEEGLDTRAVSRKEVEDYFEAKRCEMHAEIMFAWRKKQGAGFRLTNSVPFGYIRRNGESNMIKDEEVAPYLSEAFSRYASGRKMRDIAKWLNEQGVEPPMKHKKRILGKPYDEEPDQWTTDMLRCLFRNPTYTGAAANGSRQIIAENCHEPYITKEQFHAFPCNLREGENKISIRKSYKKPNPLAKHIVCTCGRALCWHKDKKTGEELFYCRYCRAHKENGKNLKVPAATIYKNVMDALELEHLEEEKLAAAIQQGAGKKAIEVVRAERSVQMKSVLAELNMEQFRRVPLYESYMANEITEEQYHAELMDYEEAHRKLNEQLTAIMEDTLVWERALSLRNPWIQQMAQYKAPEELDRSFVKKYIEQVTVTLLGDGQAEIGLTMKTYEWKQMLGRIEMEETDDGTKE